MSQYKKKRPRQNTSLKFDKTEKHLGTIATILIGFLFLIMVLVLSLPIRQWCSFNLLHRPLYFLFSDFFYAAYFIDFFKISLLFIASSALIGATVWVVIRDIFHVEFSGLKWLIFLFSTLLFILIFFIFGKSYTDDFKLVWQGKYNTEKSYLFKIEEYIHISRKYPYNGFWVDYVLYTNTPEERYSEQEIKWYFNSESDSSERTFYIYTNLNLDVYQYRDLEKRNKQENRSDSVLMTVYYLPNTKQVLQYKLQKQE